MNKNFLMMMLASLLLVPDSALAQNETTGNSRFVMTLQDSFVQRLKSSGNLQSPVRNDAQGKISAVQIQFSGTATQPAATIEIVPSVNGNVCQIRLDDAIIELAKAQPIRINVPVGSIFSKVFLVYDAPAQVNSLDGDSASNSPPPAPADATDDIVFYQHFIKLSDNETITGQMDLDQEIKFDTKFGEVDISVGQIAGIRFHIDGADAAMVVLKNGDSITGTPSSENFELNTDWGRAEFDPVFVESITTSQNARFQQTNDPEFGPRWQLIGR